MTKTLFAATAIAAICTLAPSASMAGAAENQTGNFSVNPIDTSNIQSLPCQITNTCRPHATSPSGGAHPPRTPSSTGGHHR